MPSSCNFLIQPEPVRVVRHFNPADFMPAATEKSGIGSRPNYGGFRFNFNNRREDQRPEIDNTTG